MSGKSPAAAAAAAVLQLQLNQYSFESIQNVKLPMCTKFGNDKCITLQIIQYTNFSRLIFQKTALAAAAVVQLQQQYIYKSIQNVKLLIYTKFSDNK